MKTMPPAIRNTYTNEIRRITITPNGAHIVKRINGLEELHRGNEITASAYLARVVTGFPDGMWEYISDPSLLTDRK